MKKIMILAGLILCMMLAMASAENEKWVNCGELAILISIPESCTTKYSSSDRGLYVYAGEEGAVPYVLIVPRTESLRFRNPEKYLNETYRDYMAGKYGSSAGRMTLAAQAEIGGKKMLCARYAYKVGQHSLEQMKLIETGAERDIEYTVKYLQGEERAVLPVMEAIARSLQTDNGDHLPPSVSSPAADTVSVPPAGTVLMPESPAPADTENGVYQAEVTELDRIMEGGFFTVRLYAAEIYPADQVEALRAGDRVQVNGNVYTVKSMIPHDEGTLELIPEEEIFGYIVFNSRNGSYTVMVDDETVRTHLTDVKIWMPLANNFSFASIEGSGDAVVYDADAFVSLVNREEIGELTPAHTTVQFEGGLLMTILYTEYGQ